MQTRRSYNYNMGQNPFNSLFSLLILVGILFLLFFIVKGFITILYWVAPILLIITLLINYRIVADYAISLFETFQTDILKGILKVGFTVLCYPIVVGWLFAKALLYRQADKMRKTLESRMNQYNTEQYIDFEEVSSNPADNNPAEKPTILELPKPKEKTKDNPYDNLFNN